MPKKMPKIYEWERRNKRWEIVGNVIAVLMFFGLVGGTIAWKVYNYTRQWNVQQAIIEMGKP